MTFQVVDLPLWHERLIYTLIRALGYKGYDFMLLEVVEEEEPQR